MIHLKAQESKAWGGHLWLHGSLFFIQLIIFFFADVTETGETHELTTIIELTICFHEFFDEKNTNLSINTSELKKNTISLLLKKSFFSQFWAFEKIKKK